MRPYRGTVTLEAGEMDPKGNIEVEASDPADSRVEDSDTCSEPVNKESEPKVPFRRNRRVRKKPDFYQVVIIFLLSPIIVIYCKSI